MENLLQPVDTICEACMKPLSDDQDDANDPMRELLRDVGLDDVLADV